MLYLDFFRNYLKTSWNHLVNDRLFSIVNLVGLSTGMTCVLLISLWVVDELDFDKFHEKDNRLYEVMIHRIITGDIITTNGTGDRMGETLIKELPEVELAVTCTPSSWFQNFSLTSRNNTISSKGNFVGGDYFNIFSYPLIQGNKNELLRDKKTIAISEKLAKQLFNSPDHAIGKTLEWKWQSFSDKCTITGVFKDFPANSSQQYDFLLSLDAWNQIMPKGDQVSSSGPFNSFIVLKEGTRIDMFNEKIATLSKTSFNDSTSRLFVRKYSDRYLYGNYVNGIQTGGKIMYVGLFSAIAVIILVIACINFMNLSTAKASLRVKEVGVKKALGASRSMLIFQFLNESLILSFLAVLIAVLLTWLLLPQFNSVTSKNLSLHFNARFILFIAAISIATGLLAGSYPAFYLSRFNPSASFKGALVNSVSEILVRKGLVIFQFSVSIIFIISVLMIYRQIRYFQDKNLGYNKDNIIYFEMDGRLRMQSESFITQLKSTSGVINASSTQQKIILPNLIPGTGSDVRWEGKNNDDKVRFYSMPVNYDLLETMRITIKEGRSFSRDFGSEESNIILNETAIKVMNLLDPMGKTILMGGDKRHIVGVCRDFHFNSIHEPIRPFIFYFSPAETMLVTARIAQGKEKETISRIHNLYTKFNPGYAFNYQFLDHDYQVQYASEKLTSKLSWYFAILAIIISCVGLLGLAAFTAERRKKEISIRKVLGASVSNIVIMMTKDFITLISIAICVGFPLAFWLIDQWLQNFAYHISISINVFLIAGLLTVTITFITIGYHSIKAALTNPTSSLNAN